QIDEIRTAGASLRMISDGDIAAALAPGIAGSGIDLYVGIGGAPEGLLSAAGLRCIGGGMQAQMWPRDAQELESLVNCGWSSSVDNVYRSRDLASGDDILFAATGICDSPLLRGVETRGPTVITHSVIMRLKSGSVRYVRTEHDLSRRPIRLRSALPPGADAPPRGALEIGQPQPPHRGPTIGVSDDLERRQRIPAIVLMGPPGSGKGTLGRRLEEALDLQHLSSGDIIRRALHGDGERTRQWSAVNGGRLIGDDDLWEVFDAPLREVQAAVGGAAPPRTLLIDGIPRNESQVDALAQRVQVRAVICLECADDSILVDRLRSRGASEGRGDDAADATIRRRLAVHREQTLPALRRYPGQIVRRVDAAQPVPAVCRDVIRHLVMLNAV
ncbi:MAG TPA: nucleoside monophosphate kinase, partial [Lacipirellulaceae bacterium]|nr:nucleoside monophosphate kinase [Lacipirellulaceae bacterium]